VSQKKAQLVKKKLVTYLGFEISQGERPLRPDMKETICRISLPKTERVKRISGNGQLALHVDSEFQPNG